MSTNQPDGVVYEILNTATGQSYVGSTTDFTHRCAVHLSHLRAHTHPCALLQHAWDISSSAVFQFNIIMHTEDYLSHEESIIRDLSVKGLCYNSYVPSLDITNDDLHRFTPEHRAALAASLRAYWDTKPHAQRSSTTCCHGHALTPQNTHVSQKTGKKTCRRCHREHMRDAPSAVSRRKNAQ